MTQYVSPEVEQNPTAIQQQILDELNGDGVDVRPATALYYLISIFAFLWAQLAEQTSQVFNTVYRTFGEKVARIPPHDAVQASTTVTFHAADADGPYLIPAGTEINLKAGDGAPVPFRTTIDATIPNGSTTVTPVTVVAADGGTQGNGLATYDGSTQTFSWAGSPFVTVLATSAGGVDEETDDEFQDRLTDEFTLFGRTLVTPDNFEAAARSHAGVARAMTLANFNALTGLTEAGHYTTALVGPDGETVASGVKTEVLADFQANSLLNLIPHIIDAAYATITVVFTGKSKLGYDPAQVESAAEAAVLEFLDNAVWGLADGGDNSEWEDNPVVRFQDVSTALNNVLGFDHWDTLTLNGGTADVTMPGPAALPKSDSTASGTVTAP